MRRSDQRRDAVFACYQRDVTARPLDELVEDSRPFTKELAAGVEAHRDELDTIIARHARGWELDRIAPLVRERLGRTAEQLPLPAILQGGTWAAGREIAQPMRAGGGPPFAIISDGTVF